MGNYSSGKESYFRIDREDFYKEVTFKQVSEA